MDINDYMRRMVNGICAVNGIDHTTVGIEFAMTDGKDSPPWIVRIEVTKPRKRGRPESAKAFGFGDSIARAAAMAVQDMHAYEAMGFSRKASQ